MQLNDSNCKVQTIYSKTDPGKWPWVLVLTEHCCIFRSLSPCGSSVPGSWPKPWISQNFKNVALWESGCQINSKRNMGMGTWALPGFCHDWICKRLLLGAANSCTWHAVLHLDTVHSQLHKAKAGRLRGLQVEPRSKPWEVSLHALPFSFSQRWAFLLYDDRP
jgi:hypothetical protein